MRKVVAFSWVLPVDNGCGGIERVTQRLMNGLSDQGYDCLFVLHDTENDRFMFDGEDVGSLDDFLQIRNVDTFVNQNGYSSQISELLDGAKWQGRYIVCHHNEPLYLRKIFDFRGVIAQLCARGSPTRVRIAWLARFLAYPVWHKFSLRKIADTQKRNYNRSDYYVVLSLSFLGELLELIGSDRMSKVVAISNPLSFDLLPMEAVKYAKGNEVLIVARLNDREKRISAALDAWKRIEDRDRDGWILKIVGDGPDAVSLREHARKLGLQRVVFLGHQNPLPHYRTAAIFMMTSRVEGWGLTLTEAMQTGTVPIAFAAFAAVHDIIEDGNTGMIVPNGDIAALAEATLRLMSDLERRRVLASNALASCQRYGLQAALDRWKMIL